MKINELSTYHQFVWTTLQSLEDGERIIGADLMVHAAVKDRRLLYDIIRDLRTAGYLVGSSRHKEDRGYYEVRCLRDLLRTTETLEEQALSMIDLSESMKDTFYGRKGANHND